MNTFLYEQADRKHRTGQKLNEAEWEALLAGERAQREREVNDLHCRLEEALETSD